MAMKRFSLKYIPHLAGWTGLYLFWVIIFQKRALSFSRTATVELCYLIFIAANFYFTVYYTVPKYLYKKKYLEFAALFIFGLLIAAMLRVPLATYLNSHYFLIGKPQPTPSSLFIASFFNILIWTGCIVTIKVIRDRFRFQQYVESIEKEKSKAELDFLNAQLNPHFLFNSLHSIYGNIDKTNIAARKMLLTFSDMLRYQLYDCNNTSIAIEKELNYVKNYVALQRARKEEDLMVKINIDPNVKGLVVAPLLFICFVENAFKFVGATEANENQIDISFANSNNVLLFTCINTKERIPTNNIEEGGIGITNARRRLGLLYPNRHTLDITDNNRYYKVKLTIELNEIEMSDS
jgi:two-component system LytT family sensor kinase